MSAVVEAATARWFRGGRHALVRGPEVDFETRSLSAALQERLRETAGAETSAVWVRSVAGELDLVGAHGPRGASSENPVRTCLAQGRPGWRDWTLVLPLRIVDDIYGAVALSPLRRPDPVSLARMQEIADEYAVSLDTALFVDEVRTSATSEERRRVAREIHDGVAQRIVALGYLADEVAGLSKGAAALQAVESLREEVNRIVGELRASVLDLRTDLDAENGLSGAISAYVGELGGRTDLRVQLHLDERGPRPPRAVEREVLRVAQEAINNVRRHAQAINLWVTLAVDGHRLRLVIEDDGIGGATPRAGHYGLQGMRERAARIDAALDISVRPDGGTVVTLQTGATTGPTKEGDGHDCQRLARR